MIMHNTAGAHGGGIGVNFGSPIISRNTITNNSAPFGGGVAIVGASNAQIVRNMISKNSAGSGAGVELFAAGDVFVENNKVVSNGPAGQGGGFYIVNEADELIIQNLIARNVASSGSQVYSLIPQSTKGFALINNTIVSAPGGASDAAVIADGFNKNVLIVNNIFSAVGDNAGLLCNPIYTDGPPIVGFNDVFRPTAAYGGSCAGFEGTNGNISADPLFVGKSNYQLAVGSPAINSGSNAVPQLPNKDLAGHLRIVGNTIDMGAYEYQGK